MERLMWLHNNEMQTNTVQKALIRLDFLDLHKKFQDLIRVLHYNFGHDEQETAS